MKLSDKEFSAVVEETFVTRLSDGTEVELKSGGKDITVNKENLKEYIDLILEKRFAEYNNQMKYIREGIDFVIPISNLKIYTWEEVEIRCCGDKILDIEKFKKITEYYVSPKLYLSFNIHNIVLQRRERVCTEILESAC